MMCATVTAGAVAMQIDKCRGIDQEQAKYLYLLVEGNLLDHTFDSWSSFEPPSSVPFNGELSTPSFKSSISSSVRLFFIVNTALLFFCFSTSTAQLYTTIPTTAMTIPMMFLKVSSESNSSHPSIRTQTVFM